MKKILFLNRHILTDYLLYFLSRQHEVTYLMRHTRADLDIRGVQNKRVRYQSAGLEAFFVRLLGLQLSVPVKIKKFTSIVSGIKPDILVAFDIYHWYLFQAVRYRRRHPTAKLYVYSETKALPQGRLSKTIFRFFWWYLQRNLRYINGIIVFTDQGQRFYREYLPKISVSLIPPPIDTDSFYPAREKKWLSNGILRILMSSRYESYKRHEDLLRALAQLREQNERFHLTCIGRSEKGQARVRELVTKLGLDNYVTFLDPVPQTELLTVYHQHDFLVLPSCNEAIGMVVPEAMACGIPTITSDTVGANVYVKEGETGLIFKTGDSRDLKKKILQMSNVQKLTAMSQSARKHAETFTAEKMGSRFQELVCS